jgi:hypothetical protein
MFLSGGSSPRGTKAEDWIVTRLQFNIVICASRGAFHSTFYEQPLDGDEISIRAGRIQKQS